MVASPKRKHSLLLILAWSAVFGLGCTGSPGPFKVDSNGATPQDWSDGAGDEGQSAGDPMPGDPGAPGDDAGSGGDPTTTGDDEQSPYATGPDPDTSFVPPPMTPVQQWIRDNPMFISGLTTHMPPPDAGVVNQYFDDFGATAAHLWQTAMPTELQAWAAVGRADFRWLAWTDNFGKSNNQLIGGLTGNVPYGRVGYQIGDEPGLIHDQWQDMAEIAQGIANVRSVDPGALIVVNFSFQAADVDAIIDHFCEDLNGDVISYDKYSRGHSEYEDLERFRRKGLEHNVPYWRYIRSYHSADDSPWLTDSDLTWYAFSGIVYGYTGHTWFLYQINNGDGALAIDLFDQLGTWTGQPTPLFWTAAELNYRMRNLGRVVTQLHSTDVRYMAWHSLAQPTGTRDWERGAGGDPFITDIEMDPSDTFAELSIGFFKDDLGQHYVIIQNPRHEASSFPLSSDAPLDLVVRFDFSAAGGGFDESRLVRFDDVNNTTASVPLTGSGNLRELSLTLEAGDIYVFKYANGYPFALQ